MTYFIKHGSTFSVTANTSIDLHEKLPVGTYTVRYNPMADQYSLELIEDFTIQGKIYGDTEENTTRILNTFADRPNSTGVMLSGEKGSGKTLLAKRLSIKAAESGIPTIVINNAWCGDTFNTFMQTIEQPIIVVFDEFEKVYNSDEQEAILTLLDGVYQSKKLFVLTCNDKYRVDKHMRNRPGRIYYRLDYSGLEHSFIVEYCEDNLRNKGHIDAIARIAVAFGQFNFDMLKAIVEEMNRYDETPQQVMRVLNAKPETDTEQRFNVKVFEGINEVRKERLYYTEWHGNPLTEDVGVYISNEGIDANDIGNLSNDAKNITFEQSNFSRIDAASGTFVFEKDGYKLMLTRQPAVIYSYDY